MPYQTLETYLEQIPSLANAQSKVWSRGLNVADKIDYYQTLLPHVEDILWEAYSSKNLEKYQMLCREMESLIAESNDQRHHFVLIIPIADRPQHLHSCIASLLKLCETYAYGGKKGGVFQAIQVIVADDSEALLNIEQHQQIVESMKERGLQIEYFGLDQQIALLEQLDHQQKEQLASIIGQCDKANFSHKGASIMRNITYLKLKDWADRKVLFYFFDSDQEFQVTVPDERRFATDYALNYFFHLDRIFSQSKVQILTGKVVGDPPVSPAVMANNFLEDVLAFVEQMRQQSLKEPCAFHAPSKQRTDDAAYHDLREMFGFNAKQEVFDYQCGLEHSHSNEDCLKAFADKLNQFFYGEHATRKTQYQYENVQKSIIPARTIYTGNYVFKPSALNYFIPFAQLNLRMAGPVLGPLIQASIGDAFVSANLPMLHKRTLDTTGRSEFRPGIQQEDQQVDISDEFVRQYYGDVMLFSMVELTQQGFMTTELSRDHIDTVLVEVDEKLLKIYQEKQCSIEEKLVSLAQFLSNDVQWVEKVQLLFAAFMDNMQYNFSTQSKGFQIIQDIEHKTAILAQIAQAIEQYKEDQAYWKQVVWGR